MSAGAFIAFSRRVPALVLISLLYLQPAAAQVRQPPDSLILVKRGSVIKSSSGITVISRDSVLLVPSTLKMTALDNNETTKAFYDSLRIKAYRGNLGRRLYDLVIVEPGSSDENIVSRRSITDFSMYNGLMINNISVIRLNPFGTSLMNPETESEGRADRFLNNTHVRSRERLISGYILFATGDTVSDLSLSETERNLRSLAFINDVRIIVLPVSEMEADILVITRDDYSLGADFYYARPEKGEISLFERNLAGFGHSIELGLPYDFDLESPWGVRMGYQVRNIARSWVDIKLFFSSAATEKYYGLTLKRDFMSIETKYAGGLDIREVFTTTFTGSSEISYPFEYSYQDYWAARSFLLDIHSHSRIILGARYINNNVFERPAIDTRSYYQLQKYKLWLSSLSFSLQKFYKTSFIYNYGRTEDIPYGALAVITAGYEHNEFKNRNYIGASLTWGNPPGRMGYLNVSAAASAFLMGRVTEQGTASLSMNYFTDLILSGRWRFRGFAKASLTKGFDRYSDEYLTLGRNDIVTGFRNDSLRGNQRSVVNLEAVAFSPLSIYGFRFAFFLFYDYAGLGKGYDFIPGTADVHAIGGGVRIRNNNLIINTFQIRLAWYPGMPPYSDPRRFDISGEPVLRQRGFDAGPPSLLIYR
jgi:hypothetical protein